MSWLNELFPFSYSIIWWLCLFVVCFVVWLTHFCYRKFYVFKSYLKHIPSPPQGRLLGHSLDFQTKDHLGVLSKYIKEHGETVLLNIAYVRFILLTSDYKLIKFVLTTNKVLEKSLDYKNLHRWLGKGILTGGGARWKTNRHRIMPSFHREILEKFVEVFESNGKILLENLSPEAFKNRVDIHRYVTLCTLDIICETAMGMQVNAQKNSTSDYVRSVKDMCRILIERAFNPYKSIEFLYRFTKDYKSETGNLEILHEYTNSVIKQRELTINLNQPFSEVNQRKKMPFLDLLLRQIHRSGSRMSAEEIREEVDTLMFAGHDTTASAISFALFCLANHEDVQREVLKEQRKVLRKNESVTLQKLNEMKYLEKVIMETLRLYPPVPYIAREVTEDLDYEGTILPKGLTITMFIYALHRNPKYFPNPERFDPTRFDGTAAKPPQFMPFSAGLRDCIGHKFAMAEMKSVISRVVRTYKLLPAEPYHQLEIASEIVLISKNGVLIRLIKRY